MLIDLLCVTFVGVLQYPNLVIAERVTFRSASLRDFCVTLKDFGVNVSLAYTIFCFVAQSNELLKGVLAMRPLA